MATTPVFLPGEFNAQRNSGLQTIGLQRVGYDQRDLVRMHVPLS